MIGFFSMPATWTAPMSRTWPQLRLGALRLLLGAMLSAPYAHAFEIEATAYTGLNSLFTQGISDSEVSQTLTSVSAMATGIAPPGFDPAFGRVNSVSSANLLTGSLHGVATVTNNNASVLPGFVAEAGARIDETLNLILLPNVPPPVTIVLPPGIPQGFIPVTMVLHAEGIFSALSGNGSARGYFELANPGNLFKGGDYMLVSCGVNCSAVNVFSSNFVPQFKIVKPAPSAWEVDLSLTYFVDPALPFNVHAKMTAQSSILDAGSATLDVSNTASIELRLPQGYGFTSSSGVFLSAISPVPETDAALLLSVGLLPVAIAVRRRHKTAALTRT